MTQQNGNSYFLLTYDGKNTIPGYEEMEWGFRVEILEFQQNWNKDDIWSNFPCFVAGFVKDIDGNGIMDMVVGTTAAITDEFYGKMIFALYTLDQQGNPKAVFISEARDRYYYEGGSMFAHIGSSSASDSLNTTMEYKNGKMVDTGKTANPSLYVQMNY